jgi:hypothetical protein
LLQNQKSGCVMWALLFALVLLWGWKLVDFYILGPAEVKKGMNETMDQVGRIQNTQAKQVQYLAIWAEYERNSEVLFSRTGFQGDSFVVQWSDTLHVPVFPSITHSFRLTRLVR